MRRDMPGWLHKQDGQRHAVAGSVDSLATQESRMIMPGCHSPWRLKTDASEEIAAHDISDA